MASSCGYGSAQPDSMGVPCPTATSASLSTNSRPAHLTRTSSSPRSTPISHSRCRRPRQGFDEHRCNHRRPPPLCEGEDDTPRHSKGPTDRDSSNPQCGGGSLCACRLSPRDPRCLSSSWGGSHPVKVQPTRGSSRGIGTCGFASPGGEHRPLQGAERRPDTGVRPEDVLLSMRRCEPPRPSRRSERRRTWARVARMRTGYPRGCGGAPPSPASGAADWVPALPPGGYIDSQYLECSHGNRLQTRIGPGRLIAW